MDWCDFARTGPQQWIDDILGGKRFTTLRMMDSFAGELKSLEKFPTLLNWRLLETPTKIVSFFYSIILPMLHFLKISLSLVGQPLQGCNGIVPNAGRPKLSSERALYS